MIGAYEDLGMEVVGTGYEFGHNDDYQRTAQHYVKDGTLIYDDVTGYEFEKFVEKVQPDLVGSGIKEKYVFQKMGVPFRQMHSWDYSGPYHGYDGFAIFARDMDMAINSPVWKMAKAPWKHDASSNLSRPSDRARLAPVRSGAGADRDQPKSEDLIMTQNAEQVLDHFDLFRGPEYQEMFANKKKMFENPRRPTRKSSASANGPRLQNTRRRTSPAKL